MCLQEYENCIINNYFLSIGQKSDNRKLSLLYVIPFTKYLNNLTTEAVPLSHLHIFFIALISQGILFLCGSKQKCSVFAILSNKWKLSWVKQNS